MSQSIIDENYIVSEDASVEFGSSPIRTNFNVSSISFQLLYENPPIYGTLFVEGTIYEDLWETLEDCDPLRIEVVEAGHAIIVIPEAAQFQEWIRLKWTPGEGSGGTISAAMRILPR